MSAAATIHIIAGPTASGKSARALELAQNTNGVIINCDSVQIYDDLPILTAQPSTEDLAAAPHMLYGTLHPNDICSAGHWREMVIPIIKTLLSEGKTPIICGGTGLYIKALMQGLSPMPDIPDDIRARAIEIQETETIEQIFARIEARDTVMSERLDPKNRARLIRAWEVFEATGKSLAEWQALPLQAPPTHWSFNVEKIIPEREELYARCDKRFEIMLERGALDEITAFDKRIENGEVKPSVPLNKALGLKFLRQYMAGDMSLDEATSLSQTQTRQYAKKQMTWLRNQL